MRNTRGLETIQLKLHAVAEVNISLKVKLKFCKFRIGVCVWVISGLGYAFPFMSLEGRNPKYILDIHESVKENGPLVRVTTRTTSRTSSSRFELPCTLYYRRHAAVGSVKTTASVCHCTQRTTTSVSARKDSPEKFAKVVRNRLR